MPTVIAATVAAPQMIRGGENHQALVVEVKIARQDCYVAADVRRRKLAVNDAA